MVCSARDVRLESAATMQRMAANAAKDATAESSPPCLREATKPDLLTIAAIAIAATVIADLIHEGLGHGGMCVATGGRRWRSPLCTSSAVRILVWWRRAGRSSI